MSPRAGSLEQATSKPALCSLLLVSVMGLSHLLQVDLPYMVIALRKNVSQFPASTAN